LRLAVGSLPCGRVPADQERRPVVLLEGIIIIIIILLFVEEFVGLAPEPVPRLRQCDPSAKAVLSSDLRTAPGHFSLLGWSVAILAGGSIVPILLAYTTYHR
jgi:hypothetical protein